MVPDTFMPSPGVGVPLDGMNEEECGSSDSVGGLWLTGGSAMFEWWQGLLCEGTPVGSKATQPVPPRFAKQRYHRTGLLRNACGGGDEISVWWRRNCIASRGVVCVDCRLLLCHAVLGIPNCNGSMDLSGCSFHPSVYASIS